MREAKCPYFGSCGGCSAQHIPYELQLENKKRYLQGYVKYDDIDAYADEEYGYRNRMDFIFHKDGVGFREKGKWNRIVDIKECVISNPRINTLLSEVREHFKGCDYFDIQKQSGTFKYAVIRCPQEDSSISFVLNKDSSRVTSAVDLIESFAEKTTAKNIVVTYVPKETDNSTSEEYFVVKGKEELVEKIAGKTFHYSIQGFFQNNSVMAEKMLEYSKELLKKYPTQEAHLLDLYGGVGTFGIMNAALFKTVTTVESFAPCTETAKKNAKENNVENMEAETLDAKQIKKLDLKKPLYVLTDPPRSGMHPKTIQALNGLKPDVIIYISCNPKQMGKELLRFKKYEIKSVALFDLFPQTPHMEAVVELVKKE